MTGMSMTDTAQNDLRSPGILRVGVNLGNILLVTGEATDGVPLGVAPDMGRANYLFFLKPVIAALFAMLFLGNDITVIQMFAIVVVIGCVAGEMFYVPISRTLRRNISS